MNLREQFEKLHPVPEGIYWQESITNYACDFKHSLATLWNYKHCWQGFQSGRLFGLDEAREFTSKPEYAGEIAIEIDAAKEPK